MKLFASIQGWGGYLPQKILSNVELERRIDTSHEWILKRTGIVQRHIASKEETVALMGMKAAKAALKIGNCSPESIDMILVATTTADHAFPSSATKIQALLGATKAFAFDIQAACSGFIYGLSIANNFIQNEQAKNILLIGSEAMSKIVDWQDRSTCILFGDGAAAVLLSASKEKSGILSTHLFSDGSFYDTLFVDHQEDASKKGTIKMEGREVFKHAVEKIHESITIALEENNLTIADIDWFVPHQANQRIIETLCLKHSIPMEKVILTINTHANTSAASIPLALWEGVEKGLIKKGQKILLEAFGGGFTWGSALIKW